MKCKAFLTWLEDRDLHDVSEADKAIKHAEGCPDCKDVYVKDEQLNALLRENIAWQPLPEKLKSRIDLNLDKQDVYERRKTSWWSKGIPLALAAMLVIYLVIPFSSQIQALEVMGNDIVADHLKHSDDVMIVHDLKDLSAYCEKYMNTTVTRPQLPAKYKFIGARVCHVGQYNSAHLTYMVEGKRVSLFIVDASPSEFGMKRGRKYDVASGDHSIQFWRENNKIYALLT